MSRGSCEYLSGETSDPRLSAAVWELLSSRKGFDAKADALFSLLSAEQCAPRPLLDDIVLRLERSKLAWSSVLDPLVGAPPPHLSGGKTARRGGSAQGIL